MRIKLVLTFFLFLLPSNIYGSKEEQKSNIDSEDLPNNDVLERIVLGPKKKSGPEVNNGHRKADGELIDDIVFTNNESVDVDIFSYTDDNIFSNTDKNNEELDIYQDYYNNQDYLVLSNDNDYASYQPCGDKLMDVFYTSTCYCGNRSLSAIADLRDGDYYCCVSPSALGQEQCQYTDPDEDNYDFSYNEGKNKQSVRCENGEVKHKTEPCYQKCWNSYRQSEYLFKKATLFCQEEDICLPLDQMCSGICSEDAELCDPEHLRCIGDGYNHEYEPIPDFVFGYRDYQVKSLDTKLGKDHGYCLKINNDQVYDSISRADEDKIIGTHQATVDYTKLVKSDDSIQCSNGNKRIIAWCAGTGDVCKTDNDTAISLDNPALCRNATYWRTNNFSCDFSDSAVGARCSGDSQHCSFPWYRYIKAAPYYYPTCLDKSDQVFPINTTCKQYNLQFLETYRSIFCSYYPPGRCDDLKYSMKDWFSKQEEDKITDAHGCQRSCSTPGPDCLACEHEDFFHCPSTGFCINKENVCDGHPHPSCGGDDEGVDHCYEIYYKKRTVKRYATLICPSVVYPEMDTVAVVCDDNIECAKDRDEALCRTGADKYNPLVYAMTVGAGMFYVVLKLVWFFHQRHQPFGDEEDDEDMEMQEIEAVPS